VARPLEEALGPTLAAAAFAGPRLTATEQLIAAIDGYFSPAVFLRPLAGRFLKLALHCVAGKSGLLPYSPRPKSWDPIYSIDIYRCTVIFP
jgi:hypothetical protein